MRNGLYKIEVGSRRMDETDNEVLDIDSLFLTNTVNTVDG